MADRRVNLVVYTLANSIKCVNFGFMLSPEKRWDDSPRPRT